MKKRLHSILTFIILFIGIQHVNAQCANIVYTTEYNCTTGDIDMDVTSVDVSEIPYSVTIGGVTQSVSAIGLYSFSGVSTDVTVPTEITTATQCSDEGEFTATGCSSVECSTPYDLIVGGGFEGSGWTQFQTVDGVPSGIIPIDNTWPLLGNKSAWLGGWTDTSITYVSQDVTIPNDPTATLSFWYYNALCESSIDYFSVYVDDNSELTIYGAGTNCNDQKWHKVVLDLSDYADGNSHNLKLQVNTFGGANFFIDEVMLETCSMLGIENFENNEMNISIQPNPATDKSILHIDMKKSTDISVQVVNLTGEVVSDIILPKSNTIDYPLDVEFLPNGSYLVKVSGENQTVIKKMVIIK